LDNFKSPQSRRDRREFVSFLLSAERPESKNASLCDKEITTCISIYYYLYKDELFYFAVPSTVKEIIFNSAAFGSQAKRAVKQDKKLCNRTRELEH
jgi:hypothetical protein